MKTYFAILGHLCLFNGILALSAPIANAQERSIPEKICIFNAAEKLPSIPGIAIKSVELIKMEPAAAVKAYIPKSTSSAQEALSVAREAGSYNAAFDEAMRRAFAVGDFWQAYGLLEKHLSASATDAYKVEITISAAAQTAVMGFVCIGFKSGQVIAARQGMIK